MKYFLAKFTITDGEHEQLDQCVIKAKNRDEAFKTAIKEGHDPEGEKTESYFSYGDGLTICKLDAVEEITKVEAEVLNRLGVAHYLN